MLPVGKPVSLQVLPRYFLGIKVKKAHTLGILWLHVAGIHCSDVCNLTKTQSDLKSVNPLSVPTSLWKPSHGICTTLFEEFRKSKIKSLFYAAIRSSLTCYLLHNLIHKMALKTTVPLNKITNCFGCYVFLYERYQWQQIWSLLQSEAFVTSSKHRNF